MAADIDSKTIEEQNEHLPESLLNPSDLETIDFALFKLVDEKMNIRAKTNKGWKKVPIIWASPERSFFSKEKKELFDIDGTLIYPIISIERVSMTKDLGRKGKFFGAPTIFTDSLRGGRIEVKKRIVGDKTNNFAIAQNRKKFNNVRRTPSRQSYYPLIEKKNNKIVIETLSVPMPVYVSMNYTVTLKSNYQQHMNQMLQPFITLGGHINSFTIEHEGHTYETFLKSDLGQNNNIASYEQEERIYQTQVSFEVLGYVVGEGDSQNRSRVTRRENAVEVKIPRERVIIETGQEFDPKSGFYKD